MVSEAEKNRFRKLEAQIRRRLLCFEQGNACLLKILCGMNPSHRPQSNWL